MGALEVDAATASVYPSDGPSLFYQGSGMPDIRSAPFQKDQFRPGQQPGWLAGQTVWACDNIPQARTSTQLAASQVMTAATAVSLATTQVAGVASACNIAVGVPIIPPGTTVVQFVIALDFGFTTGTTVAGSTTVTVVDNTLFHTGQWIVIGGAGNAAATRSHIAQVQTIATSNLTTITISPAAVTAIANAPIGQGNLYGSGLLPPATQFGPAAASASAVAVAGAMSAGLARVYNPREMLSRNITVQGLTATTWSGVISGWDVWLNPLTEILSLAAQTTAASKRAIKYVGSITSGTTPGASLSFGLGDTFGFPFRADEWDQTDVTWNNTVPINNNGFTAATLAVSATGTSGDVRGTIQISTAVLTGVIATAVSAVATNGTSRLTMRQTFGVWNQVAGNPVNQVPMFGIAQFTGTT
jgi:hypothetical protein